MRVFPIRAHDPDPLGTVRVVREDDALLRTLRRIQGANPTADTSHAAPAQVHGIDLIVSGLARGKINGIPIRREGWVKGSRFEIRQLLAPGPVGVHQADLVDLVDETRKDNLAFRRRSSI